MKTELVTTPKRKAPRIVSPVTDFKTPGELNQKPGVLETIDRGERGIRQGRVLTHKRAKKRLSKWLKNLP